MSNFKEDIMDKAMKAAVDLMKEKGAENVTAEDLVAAAKKITEEELAKVPTEDIVAQQEAEIARGVVKQEEDVIGGGIAAEPVPEPEVKEEKEPEDYIVRFKEPYAFEGKRYAGVDLSGLQTLRAKDIWRIDKAYRDSGNMALIQEMDNGYTARVAARASGLPIEFFENMRLPDMISVRNVVTGFFFPKE